MRTLSGYRGAVGHTQEGVALLAAGVGNRSVVGIIWLVLRCWLGYTWLMAGWGKAFGDRAPAWVGERAGAGVTSFRNGALARSTGGRPLVPAWYADFVREVALPHATAFSYLVAYGEVLVGLALLVGLCTRFAALMGVMMNLAYLFAGTISPNPQMLVAGAALAFAGTAVGYYGLGRYPLPAIGQRLGWAAAWASAGASSSASAATGRRLRGVIVRRGRR